ncbi:MAG: MFS transporter, partial [Egibacteraceae bacterium]
MSGTGPAHSDREALPRRLPGVLMPLRHRDYRLLASGSLVSMLGDGFFHVALAFQVYAITRNSTSAMSAVGIAWSGSAVATYLLGGWAGDRFERRRIMITADIVRAVALGLIGVLALSGSLELWHLLVLGVVVGSGNAFFNPAANAIVPDLLPSEDLPQANAFWHVGAPTMQRFAGPALGGIVIGVSAPGWAFLVDAATFIFSAWMLSIIRPSTRAIREDQAPGNPVTHISEGLRFVRSHSWCWAYMIVIGLTVLVGFGTLEVLLPIILKVNLGLGEREAARYLGFILASGGLGSIVMSIAVGQRKDLPRRFVTIMYVVAAAGTLALGVYGIMTVAWPGILAALVSGGLYAIALIYWLTMLQRLVPRELLSRVFSVDLMVSLGFAPIGFVVVGALGTVADPQT